MAAIEQFEIVQDGWITRLPFKGFEKIPPRGDQITAQHVRIAAIIEYCGGFAAKANGREVSPVSEIKSSQAVIAGGQAKPGGGVLGGFLDGVAEVFFGYAKMTAIKMLNAQPQRFIRGVILNTGVFLNREGGNWWHAFLSIGRRGISDTAGNAEGSRKAYPRQRNPSPVTNANHHNPPEWAQLDRISPLATLTIQDAGKRRDTGARRSNVANLQQPRDHAI